MIFTEYKNEIDRLGLRLYQPGFETDLHILNWWVKLNETGGISEVFHETNRKLTAFMKLFEPPTMLVYTLDSQNKINSATWFVPFESAEPTAVASVWVDRELRGTRKIMQIETLIYKLLFKLKKRIFAITRPERVDVFSKIGYSVIGQIPGFFEPDKVSYMLQVTQKSFEESRVYQIFGKD